MAEEPNQVEADEIKANIERTRDNMSGTIDEIQERLNPNNLIQQAKDSVREAAADKVKEAVTTAKDAVNTASVAGKRAVATAGEVGKRALNTASKTGKRALNSATQSARRAADQARASGSQAASTARDNPLGAALAASGIAWLIARGLTSRRRSASEPWSDRATDDDPGMMGNRRAQGAFVAGLIGYYLISRQTASRIAGSPEYNGPAEGASGTDGLRRSLVQPARELGASAQRLGREAQRKAGEYAGRSRDIGQQVTRWVGDNPIAVGAAAVAFGTVVGLSMTDDDDEWMSDSDGRDEWTPAARRGSSEWSRGM